MVATQLNAGDTAWLLVSTALVMLMTPGLGLFYGGMVRSKNVLATVMKCLLVLALISVQWVLFGYSLAFGPDQNGLIGNLAWWGFRGVGGQPNPDYGATVPHAVYAMFQGMFAVITPALIAGAVAERMRLSAFALFVLLWATFVYDPIAHWVWAKGGWLRELGALDFAGGTVVHLNSGVAGLVAALMVGKRLGYGREPMPPHNVPLILLGTALLWFGWFGFNAGSAVAANASAAYAFTNTHTATAAAMLGWAFGEWLQRSKPTALGIASGAVAGLVAITPAAGFVSPLSSIAIGFVAGWLCCYAVRLKEALHFDDALDVFGIHGVGGMWGALATGIFAQKAIGGASGWIEGNGMQMLYQLAGIGATLLYSGAATAVILRIVELLMGRLRVTEEQEVEGLDIHETGMEAYPEAAIFGGRPVTASLMAERPTIVERPTALPALPAASSAPIPVTPLPPTASERRLYSIVLENANTERAKRRWERLCHEPHQAPPEFHEVYRHLVSFDGREFVFRGGDPERMRKAVEKLFEGYLGVGATVTVEAG
jgi:Amt family ammonium transporter